jgi:hypothetical protein
MVDVYTAFAIILLAVIVFVSMTPPTREGLVATDEAMRKMFVDTYNVVDNGMHGLEKKNLTGNLNANRIKLGDKWTLSGVGDKHGNDDWLRLFNKDGTGYYGGLAAGRLWSGGATTLNGPTSTRDINAKGNVNVTGAVNASGNLCVQNECLNKTDLQQMKTNNATVKKDFSTGLNITNGDPGPLIQKMYGNNQADRYGLSQEPNGTSHVYAANSYGPSTVNLSFATGVNSYNTVLTAQKDGTINVTGADAKLCIDGVCLTKGDISNFKAATDSISQ